jgi:penicillin amidase
VTVRWDRWGIPHLRAERVADLWVALGYCMAQERLWQLDYMRRFARGELAAILGPEALPHDRQLRTLDLAGAANASLPLLDDEERCAVDGIAAGINAWAEQSHPLPLEFELLDYRPTAWRPVDSILLWKYRWWTLTGRLEQIVLAEALRRHLPPTLQSALLSDERSEETIVPGDVARSISPAGWPMAPGDQSGLGSNNWALAGAKTTTGAPVLCSDPHNYFGNPPQWLEAHLTAPGLDAIGAIYLGTPGIYLGRNRRLAWGVTNHAVSVRDLYREEVKPDDPTMYRDGQTWRSFEAIEQTIAVAGAPAERLTLRRTVRGPIVNPLVPTIDEAGWPPLSLRWVGYEPPSGLRAMLDLQRAATAAEFRRVLTHWPCPPLNFVVATVDGQIAYQVAGRVPVRPLAAGLRSAADPAQGWQGSLAPPSLPRLLDPERGWLATANNPPWPAEPDYRPYLALGNWSDGYRMRRIRDCIEAQPRLTPLAVGAIHGDITHQRALDLASGLADRLAEAPSVAAVAERLRAWDGRFSVDSVAATLFQAIWECFKARLLAARLPAAVAGLPVAASQAGGLARRLLLGESEEWWPAGHSTTTELQAAAVEALAGLTELAGAEPAGWAWGRLHRVTFPHPLGHRPGWQRLNVGPFATGGGVGTVRAAGFEPGLGFTVTSGSTYRLLCDLSGSSAWATVTTGLSGHLASRHYRDQVGLWLGDTYHPLWLEEAAIVANLVGETTLGPAEPV